MDAFEGEVGVEQQVGEGGEEGPQPLRCALLVSVDGGERWGRSAIQGVRVFGVRNHGLML